MRSAGLSGRYWRFGHSLKVDLVDTRRVELDAAGQEILIRDKVGQLAVVGGFDSLMMGLLANAGR